MNNHKRIAVLFSAAVHMLIFIVLSAAGFFAFLQHHETVPIDVTLYHEDSRQPRTISGQGSPGASQDGHRDADAIGIVTQTGLPAVHQQDIPAAAGEQEIKKVMSPQYVNAETATPLVAQNPASGVDAASADSRSASGPTGGITGEGMEHPGNGTGGSGEGIVGTGGGTDSDGTAEGNGSGEGARPAHNAVLISKPSTGTYYPQELRQKGISGMVTLSITIASDGTVANVEVVSSSGYAAMDAAAVQIAYLCQYKPAVNTYGQNVSSIKQLHIPFNLQ